MSLLINVAQQKHCHYDCTGYSVVLPPVLVSHTCKDDKDMTRSLASSHKVAIILYRSFTWKILIVFFKMITEILDIDLLHSKGVHSMQAIYS